MTIAAGTLLLLALAYLAVVLYLCSGLFSLQESGAARELTYSVVIAAHNEEDNIGACLQSVLAQGLSAARYEVIVVDDRSTDRTREIAESFLASHPNLRVVRVERTPPAVSPKKHAVTQGISRAVNEAIVLTDADCRVPATWLEAIDRNWSHNTGLVQGITEYRYVEGMNRFFFGLQALDFLSHGVVSAAAIGAGLPLNANANNLAFRKAAFDDVGGYGEASGVVSGDDDLLMQRIARSGTWDIRYMTDKAGTVVTAPTTTARGVVQQRKRWASKTVHYDMRQIALLCVVLAFYLSIPASLVFGFFDATFFLACAGLVVVKIFGEFILMVPGSGLFGRPELRRYLLPASLLHLPLVLWAVAGGVFGTFSWKGQRFRRKA